MYTRTSSSLRAPPPTHSHLRPQRWPVLPNPGPRPRPRSSIVHRTDRLGQRCFQGSTDLYHIIEQKHHDSTHRRSDNTHHIHSSLSPQASQIPLWYRCPRSSSRKPQVRPRVVTRLLCWYKNPRDLVTAPCYSLHDGHSETMHSCTGRGERPCLTRTRVSLSYHLLTRICKGIPSQKLEKSSGPSCSCTSRSASDRVRAGAGVGGCGRVSSVSP